MMQVLSQRQYTIVYVREPLFIARPLAITTFCTTSIHPIPIQKRITKKLIDISNFTCIIVVSGLVTSGLLLQLKI